MPPPPESPPHLALDALIVARDSAVIGPVSLELASGSRLAILGPSGSGKSSVLDAIAGIAHLAAGRLAHRGVMQAESESSAPPHRRGCAYLLQEIGLFEHLSVLENVVVVRRAWKKDVAQAGEILERVGLAGRERTFPRFLSGGEQQRLGLARVLASEAGLLLLDEPLARLDPIAAQTIAAIILDHVSKTGATLVVAAHDLVQVSGLAPDRLLVLESGRVLVEGSALEIAKSPASVRVAATLGYTLFLPAKLGKGAWSCALGEFRVGPIPKIRRETRWCLAWRPDGVEIAPEGAASGQAREVRLGPLGPCFEISLAGGHTIEVPARQQLRLPSEVRLSCQAPVLVGDDRERA